MLPNYHKPSQIAVPYCDSRLSHCSSRPYPYAAPGPVLVMWEYSSYAYSEPPSY